MSDYLIAPSILSADFARLGEQSQAVLDAGADMIHFDVMDNHYVPNLTFGAMVCQALRHYGIKADIDVHLMVEPVDSMITAFGNAGASRICFHPEASKHVHRSLDLIKQHGCKAGLVLNPATPLQVLDPVITMLDYVLVMSVNPGFGGQRFIESSIDKISQLRQRLDATGTHYEIMVDGGVTIDNIASIAKAGATSFVAGSAIFGSDDYSKTISAMREQLG